MSISEVITEYTGNVPSRDVPETFDSDVGNYLTYTSTTAPQINQWATEANALADSINNTAGVVEDDKLTVEGYKDQTLGYRNESEVFKNQAEAAVGSIPAGTIIDGATSDTDKTWSGRYLTEQVGNSAYVPVSNWTQRETADETAGWNAIAYADDIDITVAVSGQLISKQVMTTKNAGLDWVARAAFINLDPDDIIYIKPDAAQNRFISVGGAGYTAYSFDGVSFTEPARTITTTMSNVCFDQSTDRLYASLSNGNVALSTDYGVTWSELTTGYTDYLSGIIAFSGKIIAVTLTALASVQAIVSTDNGSTWSPLVISANNYKYRRIDFFNSVICAVGSDSDNTSNGVIATSIDGGDTWTDAHYGVGACISITSSVNDCVVIKNSGDKRVITSKDAIEWKYVPTPSANLWVDIEWAGINFIAVSPTGTNRSMHSLINVGVN